VLTTWLLGCELVLIEKRLKDLLLRGTLGPTRIT
jgi:hypothetical protein